jgi:serine/threonine protein kinase
MSSIYFQDDICFVDNFEKNDPQIKLMRTLACGLYELHRASEGIDNPMPRIAHRDLKPANVLISDRFEAVICDFNSSIPLIRELPHQCDCFSKPDDRNGPCRPFEPLSLLKLESHDRPGCPNRKILQKLDDVRERVFYQSKKSTLFLSTYLVFQNVQTELGSTWHQKFCHCRCLIQEIWCQRTRTW